MRVVREVCPDWLCVTIQPAFHVRPNMFDEDEVGRVGRPGKDSIVLLLKEHHDLACSMYSGIVLLKDEFRLVHAPEIARLPNIIHDNSEVSI